MRIFKDTSISIAWTFGTTVPGRLQASFLVKGTFLLKPGEAAVWAEEPDPPLGDLHVGDDPAKGLFYASDFAFLKPRADVLLAAKAHAPGGIPAPYLKVGLRAGPVQKVLLALGDRTWKRRIIGGAHPTDPAPFKEMPLSYDRSYGGPESGKNPVGRGFGTDLLPNVEDPRRMVIGPKEDADPAGFGPLSADWAQRRALVGTYKAKWLKERWPGFPEDFDWGYFNAAPRDQQVEGYLRGDEPLEFENLHPKHAFYRSRLPGLRARFFLEERSPQGDLRHREVPLVLDTLWVDLEKEKLVLVWRGIAETRTRKLKEVERMLALTEPLAGPAMSLDECPAVLDLRQKAIEGEEPPEEDDSAADAAFEKGFADMEKEMAAAGKEMDKLEAEALQAEAGQKALLISGGVDPKLLEESTAPPVEASAALAAALAAIRKENPSLAAEFEGVEIGDLKEMEAVEKEIEAANADDDPPPLTREAVQAIAAARGSLAERDMGGLDLSGLDLSGMDLHGSILKKALLKGTHLAGANLTGADLAGADLSDADLSGAVLDDADLTKAVVRGVRLIGISISDTILSKLDLKGADFSDSSGHGADFSGADLRAALFTGAKLPQANFQESNLEGADFRGAEIRAAQFDGVKARGINLEGADLTGIHGGEQGDYTGAIFRNVHGPGSIWDGSILDGADFTRAHLRRALWSEASLQGANFDRADLTSAIFEEAHLERALLTNANLLRVSFERANLTGASLQGSNCYEAAFTDAVLEKTDLRGANLKMTSLG